MPIQDSDLFLIEDTSGVSKKIEASKLKANLAANTYNNYKLLVNKSDYRSRFVYAQNLQASVGLTDYMLVERAGVSYKVTGQQIIDYLPSVPAGAAGAIVDVAGAGESIYQTDTITNVDSTVITTTGTWGPYTLTPEAVSDPNVLFKQQGGYNYSILKTDYDYLNQGTGNSGLITFNPPLTHTSNIQMWAMAQVNAGPLLINDSTVSIPWETATEPGDTLFEWVDTGVTEIRNIRVNQTSTGGMVCGIQFFSKTQDISTAFTSGVNTLTFPNSNNLDNFGVGDVVQTNWNQSKEWSSSIGINDPQGTRSSAYIFDGSVTGQNPENIRPFAFTLTLANPVTANSSIKFFGSSQNNTAVRYTVNGNMTNAMPAKYVNNETFTWVSATDISFPIELKQVGLSGGNSSDGARLVAIEVDGKLLVDPPYINPNEVKIRGIDKSIPSISTSGGSWKGSNGTNSIDSNAGFANFSLNSALNNAGSVIEFETTSTGAFIRVPTTQDVTTKNVYQTITVLEAGVLELDCNGNSGGINYEMSNLTNVTVDRPLTGGPLPLPGNPNLIKFTFSDAGSITILWKLTASASSHVIQYLSFSSQASYWNGVSLKSVPNSTANTSLNNTGVDGTGIYGLYPDTRVTKTVTYNNQLTLEGDTNLDLFTSGDAIRMVDENGDEASYTPVTSTITNVSTYAAQAFSDLNRSADTLSPYRGNYGTLFNEDEGTTGSDISWGSGTPAGRVATLFNLDVPVPFESLEVWGTGQDTYTWILWDADGTKERIPFTGGNTGYLKVPSVVVKNIEVAQVETTTGVFGMYSIRLNGQHMQDNSPLNRTTLTFASPNKDLKFFNPGDVVQSVVNGSPFTADFSSNLFYADAASPPSEVPIKTSTVAVNSANAFNGDTTGSPANVVPKFGDGYWLDVPMPFKASIIQFRTTPGGTQYKLRAKIYDDAGGEVDFYVTGQGNTVVWFEIDTSSLTGNVTDIVMWLENNSMTLWGIRAVSDNVLHELIDGSSSITNFEVASTDIAANSMVVSGGAWKGSDGSAIGGWNQSKVWSSNTTATSPANYSAVNSFDGLETTYSRADGRADISFQLDMAVSGVIEVLTRPTGTPVGYNQITIYNNTFQQIFDSSGNVSEYPNWTNCGSLTNAARIRIRSDSNNQGPTLYGVKINGELLVDAGIGGDPAETEVTAPVKSGTGNFAGNIGVVVDVTNSNQEWVSNDNRLDESFFIKSASTRTGLAILRTKAIAQSQAWADSNDYESHELVKHNGRYWLSLSASTGNSPDVTDELDWFDLGAIEE
jgi:hypothetical protein